MHSEASRFIYCNDRKYNSVFPTSRATQTQQMAFKETSTATNPLKFPQGANDQIELL